MFGKKPVVLSVILVVFSLFCTAAVLADDLENSWSDFIHYAKIGRIELAKSYGQKIIDSDPNSIEMLGLSKANPAAYNLLLNMYSHSSQLKDVAGKILDIIEDGRYQRRTDASIIAEEIKRLSSTSRGRLKAIERLKNSGEYAVVQMIDALNDPERKAEFANIASALPEIGRDAVRPLVVALQIKNVAVKFEIIKALGKIGYPQALGCLKYIAENDKSPELKQLAMESVNKINSDAGRLTAAELFYFTANDYYYEKESLAVRAGYDFGNEWFWNAQDQRLYRQQVDIKIFYHIMAMRNCEWALRADANAGKAIGLWIASFFKAESKGIAMPKFFGSKHADAMTYAKTAGAKYLHMALERALKDNDAYVALNTIEALAASAGEKSLLYRIGTTQPLIKAMSSDNKAIKILAAIAIGQAGPASNFPESSLIVGNLAYALKMETSEEYDKQSALVYSFRAMSVLLKLAMENNTVVDVMQARDAVISSLNDDRDGMKVLAVNVLAYLDSPDAQRAIAGLALGQAADINVRLRAFSALAISAKKFGNLLEDEQISQIYALIGSDSTDSKIRTVAAAAYGALNLPSDKVKELILDQSKI